MATKTVKYIRPDSSLDPTAESYEYFLVWMNPDGAVYNWLFEDFERKLIVNGDVINTKTSNITKLYDNAFQTVMLTAEDLTENEVETISNILRAKIIRRYYKDGTFDNLSINTKTFKKQQSEQRYFINIEVVEIEKPLLI